MYNIALTLRCNVLVEVPTVNRKKLPKISCNKCSVLSGDLFRDEKYHTLEKRGRGRSWDVIQRCLCDVLADYPPERER